MVEIRITAKDGCKVGSTFHKRGERVYTDPRIADDLVARGLAVYAAQGKRET